MTESAPQPLEEAATTAVENQTTDPTPETARPQDSYVKLAMRNMVRKGRQSLWHFFLTTVGLLGILVGLAFLTKP